MPLTILHIVSTTPVAGATGMPPTQLIGVTFSEATTNLNSSNFYLKDSLNNIVPTTLSVAYGGTSATLKPISPLTLTASYTATVTTGVTDKIGTPLNEGATWTFSIWSSGNPSTPFQIVGFTPTSGLQNANLNQTASVTFSDFPLGVSTSTFYLKDANAQTVPSTVNLNGRTATLTPSQNLNTAVTYTLYTTNDITDLRGLNHALATSWTFTTYGPPPDPAVDPLLANTLAFSQAPAVNTNVNVTPAGVSPNAYMDQVSSISSPFGTINNLNFGGETFTTFASKQMSLSSPDNKAAYIFIVNASGKVVNGTDRFLLQTIGEEFNERVQVTETFQEDATSIFFFGRSTVPFSFVGKLYNTNTTSPGSDMVKGQWTKGFTDLWNNFMRASKLVSASDGPRIALLYVNDEYYQGYPINLRISKSSADDYSCTFSMSWLITNHDHILDKHILDTYMYFGDSKSIQEALTQYNVYQTNLGVLTGIKQILDMQISENEGAFTFNLKTILNSGLNWYTDFTGGKGTSALSPLVVSTTLPSLVTPTIAWSPAVLAILKTKYDKTVPAVDYLVSMTDTSGIKIASTSSTTQAPEPGQLVNTITLLRNYVGNWVAAQNQKLGVK